MVVVDEGEEDDEGDEEEGVEDDEEDEEEEEEEEEVVVEEGEEEDLAEGDEGETPVVYEMDEEDEEPEDGDDEEGEPGVRVGHEHCKAPCKRTQHCWMLHVAPVGTPVAFCGMLLLVFGSCCAKFETIQTYEPTTPNISFVPFLNYPNVTQQCWICSYSSCDIVRVTHTHSTMSPKSYQLYPSHGALQIPTLLGSCGPTT